MKKTFVSLLLAAVMLCGSVFPVYAQAEASQEAPVETVANSAVTEEHVLVAETDALALWVNVTDCQLVVRQKDTAKEWLSFPSDLEQRDNISRNVLQNIKSQIVVSFLDSNNNIVTAGSFKESVQKDTYEVIQVENGVQITYDFSAENMAFRIPVQVILKEDYAQAILLYDQIEEYGASRITGIDLMPYFGAGAAEEEGYLFLPDGSGALTYFKDNSRSAEDWRQRVYGPDPAVNLMLKNVESPQTVRMPIFGIKKENSAFLAIITEGDTAASVFAYNRADSAPYAAVGSSFIYHQYDMTGLRQVTGVLRPLPLTQEQPVDVTPTVRYYFLDADDADYNGMARTYRAYLEKECGLKRLTQPTGAPVSLSFYGAAMKESRFLGIPYNKKIVATKFSQVADVLQQLETGGVTDPNVFLYGFEKGGYQNNYQKKQTFDFAVGGKKGYLSLLDSASDATFYTAATLTKDYGSAFSVSRYIRSLNRMSVLRRPAMLSTGDWDFDDVQWRYLRPQTLAETFRKWLQSAVQADNSGILLGDVGKELYSDIRADATPGRDRTQAVYLQALSAARTDTASVAAEGANLYLAGNVDVLTDVPTCSSKHDIISEDVPFIMMVLHGYVQMVSEPINRMSDRAAVLPVLLGTGVQANWQLTSLDPVKLTDTGLDFLYNSKADGWIEEIVDTANAYATVQQAVGTVAIQSHQRANGLEIYTYENGIRLLANTGTQAIVFEQTTVPAGEVLLLQ